MIKSIQLTNFLSFGASTQPIELKALNVIVGPNGSGKSKMELRPLYTTTSTTKGRSAQ
ncbi:AAA family ATPase [Dickeya dianthicola]|uniref:AAA family ATPase n=1 Tax=Dickeya dianthicola TaxID=204039 RepID=UPI0003A466F0|nr:AAA family ATPase [Dickeya dianthicola]MCI4029886.1 AAA family ATPase [Dickeya dianthicola]MCI4175246.1 AAA family ATPase [Dickeya dianthicola]MCI4179198.1 AAA family ATPase [Dickeya dianthicola]MCI4183210.1 AAA family ATPase [Dickeya dianthicola]MCI4187116.1 AAA family ATPase [Dickeya dianthicola]